MPKHRFSTLETIGNAVGLHRSDDDRHAAADESFEHMKEVEKRTSGFAASFFDSGPTRKQALYYWLENYVAADSNAMIKILIYLSGASIIGFALLWAAIEHYGSSDASSDWIFAGAVEKMWFVFQMLATADYKDDVGTGYKNMFWTVRSVMYRKK
jgi:hypothetical protein